jgi:O-antigen ligase
LIFRSRADLFRFVLIIFASSIIPSLYACVDIWLGRSNLTEFRLQSTFMHPNIYAFYLVVLLGLALYVRASQAIVWPLRFHRVITWYIPILLFFIALTKTRSAYLAAGALVLYYALCFDRRFLFGLLFVPLLLYLDPSIADRILEVSSSEEIDDLRRLDAEVALDAYAWRQLLWSSAMPLIEEKPWLGHGLESFRYLSSTFFPLSLDGFNDGGTDAHNLYLQVLFEIGVVGILAVAWLFGALAWQIAKGLASDRRGIWIVFGILGAFMLESYSDNMAGYLASNWYFWFAMGTVCAWAQFENSARNSVQRGRRGRMRNYFTMPAASCKRRRRQCAE